MIKSNNVVLQVWNIGNIDLAIEKKQFIYF